jgi:hypothetical protein
MHRHVSHQCTATSITSASTPRATHIPLDVLLRFSDAPGAVVPGPAAAAAAAAAAGEGERVGGWVGGQEGATLLREDMRVQNHQHMHAWHDVSLQAP